MTKNTIIKSECLSGGYGEKIVISDISFEVKTGDFLGIIGPNGSGKSTLLRLMSKIITPQKGKVVFENTDLKEMSLKNLSRRIAFVPQDTIVNFSYTSKEIVLLGRIPHLKRLQHERKLDYEIADKALELTGSSYLKNRYINELSAGERQRIFISRALAQEPSLILLDEPTSHLDIGHQIQLLDLLKKLNKENNLTIIIVLHDLNLASEYCDSLLLLDKGRIYKQGSPVDVLTYQNIEKVYQTLVVVKENPISSKPYCILVSNKLDK